MKQVTKIIKVFDDGSVTVCKPRAPNGKRSGNQVHIGWSKLNEDMVLKIRAHIDEGVLMHKDIAKMFGVSKSTITNIYTRKTWAHLA